VKPSEADLVVGSMTPFASPPSDREEAESARLLRATLPYPDQGDPAYRANPYPEVTNLACRIPLRYFVLCARDCSSWRPGAD